MRITNRIISKGLIGNHNSTDSPSEDSPIPSPTSHRKNSEKGHTRAPLLSPPLPRKEFTFNLSFPKDNLRCQIDDPFFQTPPFTPVEMTRVHFSQSLEMKEHLSSPKNQNSSSALISSSSSLSSSNGLIFLFLFLFFLF
jgi:hypothetical protein